MRYWNFSGWTMKLYCFSPSIYKLLLLSWILFFFICFSQDFLKASGSISLMWKIMEFTGIIKFFISKHLLILTLIWIYAPEQSQTHSCAYCILFCSLLIFNLWLSLSMLTLRTPFHAMQTFSNECRMNVLLDHLHLLLKFLHSNFIMCNWSYTSICVCHWF